jgi:uncharacterized membrane protein
MIKDKIGLKERTFEMFGFLIVLLCIGAYFYFKQNGCCHSHASNNSHQDALDILRARYARGEISDEEFNERKKALE